MKQKADRKKAIRRLTALSSRLQMLGAALVLVGVVSSVQLFRTEILVKPEPTEPTQIQTTEETTVSTTIPTTTKNQLILGSPTMAAEEEAKGKQVADEWDKRKQAATETSEDVLSNSIGDGSGMGEGTHNNDGGHSEEEGGVLSDEGQNQADSVTGEKTNAPASGEIAGGNDDTLAKTISAEGKTPNTAKTDGDSIGKIPENGSEDNEPGTKKAKAPQGLPCPPPTDHVPETEPTVPELPEKPEQPVNLWLILAILSGGLLILDLIAIAAVQKKLKKLRKGPPDVIPTTERIPWHAVPPEIGKVHGIGGRDYQQDSLGHTRILNGSGVLAIVADGMGGLSNGEQVSQQIVMDGLGYGAAMTGLSEGNPLLGMVGQINTGVNRMLGPERIYKCGSTLIAVLVAQDQFHWVSVGDSRIYLYREGYVNQLNTDHDLFQQWMPEILAGTRSYAEAARNPDGRKLTSFIGMGELKYVDYSRQPIDLRQGDRLVLVTDGVYGTVPPEQLADILKANPEVSDAAKALERRIRDARMPHQDNYTALILGF